MPFGHFPTKRSMNCIENTLKAAILRTDMSRASNVIIMCAPINYSRKVDRKSVERKSLEFLHYSTLKTINSPFDIRHVCYYSSPEFDVNDIRCINRENSLKIRDEA